MHPEPITRLAPEISAPVLAQQAWRTVTFVHWRVDTDDVRALMPPGIEPDLHDGSSWVGLIAFRFADGTLGRHIPLGWFGDFTEVNVRLYGVDAAGRRGVVFCSLDASRLAAVLGARLGFGLPYVWARTTLTANGTDVAYAVDRHRGDGRMRLAATWDPTRHVDDDTSAFLTARWGAFVHRAGRTRMLANTHEPWTLHPAELTHLDENLLGLAGLTSLAGRAPDSVLFSPGVLARFGRGRAGSIPPSAPAPASGAYTHAHERNVPVIFLAIGLAALSAFLGWVTAAWRARGQRPSIKSSLLSFAITTVALTVFLSISPVLEPFWIQYLLFLALPFAVTYAASALYFRRTEGTDPSEDVPSP